MLDIDNIHVKADACGGDVTIPTGLRRLLGRHLSKIFAKLGVTSRRQLQR
jgi:hypothetical protein